MWWINNETSPFKELGAYAAMGQGSQTIDIIPGANLVYVHRTDTDAGRNICCSETTKLLRMILDAKVSEAKENPQLIY